MRIKKYLVKSFDEALSRIKKELGDEAYIMSTKKIEKKGPLNLSREEWIEVTAAIERDEKNAEVSRFSPQLLRKAYGENQEMKPIDKDGVTEQLPRVSTRPKRVDVMERIDPIQPLRDEISELKWMLQNQSNPDGITRGSSGFSGQYDRCYKNLLMKGVDKNLAVRFIDNLMMSAAQSRSQDENAVNKRLVDVISAHIGKSMPIVTGHQTGFVVLVGPTGVGKTTTIAKMAAYFKLLEGKRVALASMDGFRIGGFAQLRTYGDLIDIPVFALRDQADMAGVVNRAKQYDLILIDTPGFSPEDHGALDALAEKIAALNGADPQIHLLLDATRKESDLKTVFKAYEVLRPTRLIFSKVDESGSIGALINTKIHSGLPISYLTVGQRVPEDIEVAHPRRVASRLLGLFGSQGGRS